MLISMTGYGRGEARNRQMAVAMEVKTINHRHLETVIKLPGGLWELEAGIKEKLQAFLVRGRVEVYLHLLSAVPGVREPVVDTELAAKYLEALEKTGRRLGIRSQPELNSIIRLPEVVRVEERPIRLNLISGLVGQALDQALRRLVVMRRAEGKKIGLDIRLRLKKVRQLTLGIKQNYTLNQRGHEARLRQKIGEWLNTNTPDGRRFVQDAILKYVRADITEEIVRLGSHIHQFEGFIKSAEAVGRRLDFLLQEMNREINTIGSKTADAGIAQEVVSLKEEVEKIREQVQNIE
jgi:uncharacterized protein (TIGR00255 family)